MQQHILRKLVLSCQRTEVVSKLSTKLDHLWLTVQDKAQSGKEAVKDSAQDAKASAQS